MFYVGLLIVWLCVMDDIVLFIVDCVVLICSAVYSCLINLLTYLRYASCEPGVGEWVWLYLEQVVVVVCGGELESH